ncbi:single-stranded-DNA-specific exonuclease RecJ [Candidatus Cardinium hertigii]|nr:single-stranded-DNA-specific exonuclease RecJ [Candidatus Cardinium hertigii]
MVRHPMPKHWVIRYPKENEKIILLEKEIGVPTPLSTILVDRSIETFDSAKQFFRPSLEALHDPFLMLGMGRAVARLMQALYRSEQILIYGDYDVDGTTAVAMVYLFLQQFSGSNIRYYVPDRMLEGYGVSLQAIEQAYQNGVKLILTLDCGIKAYEAIASAVALGIDVIVCDHHEVGDSLPLAYAILNPKQGDCTYPFKELSGCGIAFKFVQACCKYNGWKYETVYPYLDLVAISTACDMVPLVDENRILTYHGIKQLAQNARPALQALMEVASLAGNVTMEDLLFKIGPRVNVAGRIGHASLVVQLLVEKDIKQARTLAQVINQQNLLRRELDHTITQEALSLIAKNTKLRKSNVLFNPDWHKGIIGIVASRCIEQHHKPTIVLTLSNGKATGSARSVPGYNIYEAIASCSALLCQYGGHAFAAGLTLPLENISDFQEMFEEVVADTIADHLLIPRQSIHALLSFQDITQKFVNILMQMAPFGLGNPMPVFVSNHVYASSYSLLKGQHLKLQLYQLGCKQHYTAIGFGLAAYESLVASGNPFSIAYTIAYNYFLGNKSLQLIIKDFKETV